MKRKATIFSVLLAAFLFFSTPFAAQTAPKLVLSTTRIQHHGFVKVTGSGFTPKRNVSSHLRRPDGSEFPVLPILTNDRGEFLHEIDTLLLAPGAHQVWVVDDASGVTSNLVQFEVTLAPSSSAFQ